MTLEATSNVTSSQVSEDGHTPCGLLDGQMTDLFGQALAPASPSAPRAASVAATMSATYGLRSSASSQSAALERSLASRLPALLDSRGSTMYVLTWKVQATPQRRRICRLAALGVRRPDGGCGGWQTPTTRDGKGKSGLGNRLKRGKPGKPHVANLCDQLVDIGRQDLIACTKFRAALMGYPGDLERCAPTATPSSRRSRQRS